MIQINKLKKRFSKDLERRLDYLECSICHRMINKKFIRTICINKNNENIIDQINSLDKIILPLKVCSRYCLHSIQTNTIPKFSILNDMFIYNTPNELKNLNIFEMYLIQLAKCFQTVTTLKTVSNTSYNKYGVKSIKGIAAHLPLNTEQNIELILKQTMPNLDNFLIIIESNSVITKQTWQELIDLNKVFIALNYLKTNNCYYSMININYNFLSNQNYIYEKIIIEDNEYNKKKKQNKQTIIILMNQI